jgi:hypothetical protein
VKPSAALLQIPIIFIHISDSDYLEHALWQACQYNRQVILIGEEQKKIYPSVLHCHLSDYSTQAEQFAQQYRHLHDCNPYGYELFCLKRWFVIKQFMETHQLQRCMYCDSDVMLYCNPAQESEPFFRFDVSLCRGSLELDGISGHTSLWSLQGISNFCRFANSFYTDPKSMAIWEAWFCSSQRRCPGISDMVVLGAFVRQHGEQCFGFLTDLVNDALFDFNLSFNTLDNKLQMTDGANHLKDICVCNNRPVVYHTGLQRYIRLSSIHFQGTLKELMPLCRFKHPERSAD